MAREVKTDFLLKVGGENSRRLPACSESYPGTNQTIGVPFLNQFRGFFKKNVERKVI